MKILRSSSIVGNLDLPIPPFLYLLLLQGYDHTPVINQRKEQPLKYQNAMEGKQINFWILSILMKYNEMIRMYRLRIYDDVCKCWVESDS